MSSEQYSPLDTTLPFFSNQIFQELSLTEAPLIIPFLSKLKGIARRIKITVNAAQGNEDRILVYFNGDLENPSVIAGGSNQTFNRWVKTIRLQGQNPSRHGVLVEYDVVPVEYLPPKTRVG